MGSSYQLVFSLACVLLCMYQANAGYFRYACKPNGDISAINPNSTKYKHAYAFNSLGNCKSEMVDNGTVIKVTDCPKGENATIVNIILNQKSRSNIFLIGGEDHKTVAASCSLEKNNYLDRVQISMSTEVLVKDTTGFPPGFFERPTNVTIEMFDVTEESGYDVFTLSYPIGITITGPPDSEIFPEVCTAYSGMEVGQGPQKVILENGCAMEDGFMFSFSTQEANWYDRDIDNDEDMGRFVVSERFKRDVMDNKEEELPPPPKLFTNAYAFRLFSSNYVSIQCNVRICAPGSESCKLPCDEFTTTTTAPTTTTIEPTPEGEVDNDQVLSNDKETDNDQTLDTANEM